MSEVEEESSCSLPEEEVGGAECESGSSKPQLSFFHVQPPSLSHGYEESPEYSEHLKKLGKDYENTELVRKDRVCRDKLRNNRLKEYAKWLDFKKPLDERRLCQAVSMNDTASVIHLLGQGVSPNCHDSLLRYPLHLAACKGYAHIVKILLDAGASVNVRDPIGNTPLHLAACTNHIDVVLLLLQAGSDGLSNDVLGRSPLQLAQSKLKILQKSSAPDQEVRNQVTQVIELLLMFSRGDQSTAEQLSALWNRVSAAESRAEVDVELRSLLDSLGSLSISQEQLT